MHSLIIGSGIVNPGLTVAAPTGLSATAIDYDQIDLAWTDNADNEDGYKIERAPDDAGDPGVWAQIDTTAADAESYSDTTVAPATKYHYRVRAYKGTINSDYSNVDNATSLYTFNFTTSGGVALDPVLTVSDAPDITWLWPDDSTTSTGAVPNPVLTQAGNYEVAVSDVTKITGIAMNNDTVTAFSEAILPDLTNLTTFNLGSNAGFNEDISGWSFPNSVTTMYFSYTAASGNMASFSLPTSGQYLVFHNTSVSGDIGGWSLPTGIIELEIYSTSVSGDISQWTIPATMTRLFANATSVGYSTNGALDNANNNMWIKLENCAFTEAEVDEVLDDLVTSGATNGTLTIHGTNAAPSAGGLADKATLEGRGWSVTVSA